MGVSKELLMRRRNLGSPHIATATGAVASFAGNMTAPLKECKCEFTPVQASGTPSPENPLPISGWTGANIYVSPTIDPQDGNTYAVDWTDEAGTVYGGYVDPVRGVLVATYRVISAKDKTSWTATSNHTVYSNFSDGYNEVTTETPRGKTTIYCNIAKYDPDANGQNNNAIWWGGNPNNKNINIRLDDINTSEDSWLEYIANNDVFICYRLATPIEYPLTPQVIKTLKGVNNVFGDTNGDIKVKYWKH